VEMVLGLLCHFFPQAATDNGQNFVTGLTSKMTVPTDVSILVFNSQKLIEFCADLCCTLCAF